MTNFCQGGQKNGYQQIENWDQISNLNQVLKIVNCILWKSIRHQQAIHIFAVFLVLSCQNPKFLSSRLKAEVLYKLFHSVIDQIIRRKTACIIYYQDNANSLTNRSPAQKSDWRCRNLMHHPSSDGSTKRQKKVTSTFYIYTQEVRILQNELKVENVQLRIWASSNLKLTTFTSS